jgi:ATP-dependent RNA circularization protein (DNA/RNA ligase family)
VVEMLTELCNEEHEVILYGEIYGRCSGQDLDYAVEDDDFGYRVFDLMIDGKYQDYWTLAELCALYGIPMVPILYIGPFKHELVEHYTYGKTTLGEPQNKFNGREGIVITALREQICCCGRMIVKSVSADYLERKGALDNE